MDSNLSYFSLPFVDCADLEYDELHPTLPSHGSLLGADDDVLARFLSEDDPLEEPDLNGPTTLHCEICRKQFDNAKKYYGHLRVHSKNNLWTCDKCPNEKFSTKQQLMKHGLTHQPLEKVWRCPQCEMSFEALWRLQQHLFAKHLDYRPHKCDVCSKAFHKLSDLDKHKDIHEDKKKHACIVCKKKFVDKSNLKRHMLTHGTEKPHPCPGCGQRFKQIASMRRHSVNCPLVIKTEKQKLLSSNQCRVCGLTFQYKSSLLEHCVREHSNNPSQPPPEKPKDDQSNQLHVDSNRTVDNIVDDILSAEDDYLTMSTQNELVYPTENPDNLMQIELLKEINQMHILDDELLYNDIDLDSFQTMCNNIDCERNELFDLNDGRMDIINGRSLDQDLMNALVRGIEAKDEIPKDFIEPPEMDTKVNEFLNPPVSVNECATIFESDVDLEASTNLAANLNQLISENTLNTVQYIATENDDTFIISLNSEIDTEQLTDMLNIGVDKSYPSEVKENEPKETVPIEPLQLIERRKELTEKVKSKRTRIMYVCLKCKKIFKTKHNYTSHRGTHDSDLQQFKCQVCLERFSYKSTLNKHTRKKHTPIVKQPHTCSLCDKNYNEAWQLKQHIERSHKCILPYQCEVKDCGKKFYIKYDLDTHARFHTGEKPYLCNVCNKGFKTPSHRARHVKNVDCAKHRKKNTKSNQIQSSNDLAASQTPGKTSKSLLLSSHNSKIEDKQIKSFLVSSNNSKVEDKQVKSFLVSSNNSKVEDKQVKSFLVSSNNSKVEDKQVKSFLVSSNNSIIEDKQVKSFLVSSDNSIIGDKQVKSFLVSSNNSKVDDKQVKSFLVSSNNSIIEDKQVKSFLVSSDNSIIGDKQVKSFLVSSNNSIIEDKQVKSLLVSMNSKMEDKAKRSKSIIQK